MVTFTGIVSADYGVLQRAYYMYFCNDYMYMLHALVNKVPGHISRLVRSTPQAFVPIAK